MSSGSRISPSIAASVGAGACSQQRRSSSACWIQDGASEGYQSPIALCNSSYSSSSSEDELPDAEDTSASYDNDCEGDAAYLLDGSCRGSPAKLATAYPFAAKTAKKEAPSHLRRYGCFAIAAVATLMLVVVSAFRLGGAVARRLLEGSGGSLDLRPLKGEHSPHPMHRQPLHHHLTRGGAEDHHHQQQHQHSNNKKDERASSRSSSSHREDHWDLHYELASLRAELEAKERELEKVVSARNQKPPQAAEGDDSKTTVPRKSADPNDAIPLDHKFKLASLIKTIAYDIYGTGVHDVEFHVRYYPDAKAQEPEEGVFVAEIADFETTPLSSFLFLEQVNHGLWDDTSFPVNAPHMLLAQPTSAYSIRNHTVAESSQVVPRRSRLPEMQALGLDRLPIMEYQDEWGQHAKYTIGFGSSFSTAGSFFFVNKADNTRAHENQACFGQVVEGVDVIDRVFALQDHDANFKLRRPVEIVSARVVPHEDHEHHDAHDHHDEQGDYLPDHHDEDHDHHDEDHDHHYDHNDVDHGHHHDHHHNLHHDHPSVDVH
jgi:cyclophilin family peptidyl-prolyl cis-trans isomerase